MLTVRTRCLIINCTMLKYIGLNSITPATVTYGLDSFRFKASQIWNSIPNGIQISNQAEIKEHTKVHGMKLCKCNMCKLYVPNLGYIENTNAL